MKAAGFLDKYKDTVFVHIIQGGQILILMSNLCYLKFSLRLDTYFVYSPMILTSTLFRLLPSNSP
jgi:hypothetical protein